MYYLVSRLRMGVAVLREQVYQVLNSWFLVQSTNEPPEPTLRECGFAGVVPHGCTTSTTQEGACHAQSR